MGPFEITKEEKLLEGGQSKPPHPGILYSESTEDVTAIQADKTRTIRLQELLTKLLQWYKGAKVSATAPSER